MDFDLHIPVATQGGLAELARMTHARQAQMEPEVHSPLDSEPNRKERETQHWLQSYKQFERLWRERSSDTIGDHHPLQDWVTRQRKHARNAKLLPWKRTLLDAMGFPYVASRALSTPSDLRYARLLHAFCLRHGHFSSSNAVGGRGLTRWVALMAGSDGTRGMDAGNATTAKRAHNYLQRHIPGFDFNKTSKRNHNLAHGLSFNGFAKSAETSARAPSGRTAAVMLRAQAAMAHGCGRVHNTLNRLTRAQRTPATQALLDVVSRAAFYDQAIRVIKTTREGTQAAACLWLVAVRAGPAIRAGKGVVMTVVSLPDPQAHTTSGVHVTITRLVAQGDYVEQGSLYQVILEDADQNQWELDYDVHLADTTHCGVTPYDCLRRENPQHHRVDWPAWMDGSARPERLSTVRTTANIAFESNLAWLQDDLRLHQADMPHDQPPDRLHLTWSATRASYKFIEHMLLRLRQGRLPPSHVERLNALPVNWGSANTPIRDLLRSAWLRAESTRDFF